jgi:hypothetical protein
MIIGYILLPRAYCVELCKYFPSMRMFCGQGSVVGLATGYGLDGPGIESRWGEIFRTRPDRPWSPPSLLYNGYRFFPGGKSGRGVTLTSHPLLMPWSRKSRVIPLHPLWAVRPLESLRACTRVHFTYLYLCRCSQPSGIML